MNDSLKPVLNLPSLDRDIQPEKATPSDRETQLYAMSKTGGWTLFSGMCTDLLNELDQANKLAISQGLSFADIGQNTVVVSMTKDVINRLLEKVADARKACEQSNES